MRFEGQLAQATASQNKSDFTMLLFGLQTPRPDSVPWMQNISKVFQHREDEVVLKWVGRGHRAQTHLLIIKVNKRIRRPRGRE